MKTKTFFKELANINKRPHHFEYGERVHHPFYLAPKLISYTKLSFISDGKGLIVLRSSGYVEKMCDFDSRTSARVVYEFNIFGEEKEQRVLLSDKPQGSKQEYLLSGFRNVKFLINFKKSILAFTLILDFLGIETALHQKPYFPNPGISWKAKKYQVNIIFPSPF